MQYDSIASPRSQCQESDKSHSRCNVNLKFLWPTHKFARCFPWDPRGSLDARFIYRRQIYNSFAPWENGARREMRVRSRELLLSLPRERAKLYYVCLVDDASGGTDHTDWFVRVSNALTMPGREEGRDSTW